jgi:hypothetical protein
LKLFVENTPSNRALAQLATVNPAGRGNYEPNSSGPFLGGPREQPVGFTTTPRWVDTGVKNQLWADGLADSVGRQFLISHAPIEGAHVVDASAFEVSRYQRLVRRLRTVVAGLRNVNKEPAGQVADGLGLAEVPERIEPARQPGTDLASLAAARDFVTDVFAHCKFIGHMLPWCVVLGGPDRWISRRRFRPTGSEWFIGRGFPRLLPRASGTGAPAEWRTWP